MMTTSTTQMLRVMQPTKTSLAATNKAAEIAVPIKNIDEKQLKLTSSPSMVDILNHCLNPKKVVDSTPTR